jgi:hypothetical protein
MPGISSTQMSSSLGIPVKLASAGYYPISMAHRQEERNHFYYDVVVESARPRGPAPDRPPGLCRHGRQGRRPRQGLHFPSSLRRGARLRAAGPSMALSRASRPVWHIGGALAQTPIRGPSRKPPSGPSRRSARGPIGKRAGLVFGQLISRLQQMSGAAATIGKFMAGPSGRGHSYLRAEGHRAR